LHATLLMARTGAWSMRAFGKSSRLMSTKTETCLEPNSSSSHNHLTAVCPTSLLLLSPPRLVFLDPQNPQRSMPSILRLSVMLLLSGMTGVLAAPTKNTPREEPVTAPETDDDPSTSQPQSKAICYFHYTLCDYACQYVGRLYRLLAFKAYILQVPAVGQTACLNACQVQYVQCVLGG
jgi:hypothetical protein